MLSAITLSKIMVRASVSILEMEDRLSIGSTESTTIFGELSHSLGFCREADFFLAQLLCGEADLVYVRTGNRG
jgi:hypothetical protein